MRIALELIDRSARERIQDIWLGLSAIARPSYFLSWSWTENWLDLLPPEVPMQLAVISADGVPCLAFFLGSRCMRRHGFVSSKVRFLNACGIDDYDELVIEYNSWLATDRSLTLRAVLDLLPDDWDEIELPALDVMASPGDLLSQGLGPYRLKQRGSACAMVDLDKVRASGNYLELLSSNTRSQIRRTAKLYAKRGPLRLEAAQTNESAVDTFNELLLLHDESWTTRGTGGAFIPFVRAFHERLVRQRFASGEIQLLRLQAGDETIACLYNFVWNGVVYFYQSGIRYESDGRLKPGLLCHAEAVRHNSATGHRLYDFLAGDSQYKRSLATDSRDLIWARIQKPRLRFRVEDVLEALWRRLRRTPG
jgi:CelD/BcsL family acetyltransferase involved in cellulose biosynthesis